MFKVDVNRLIVTFLTYTVNIFFSVSLKAIPPLDIGHSYMHFLAVLKVLC